MTDLPYASSRTGQAREREIRDPSFGHRAASIAGAHIDAWGAGPFVIRASGKRVLFEDSAMFGPVLLRWGDWQPVARRPGVRSPFWHVWQRWQQAGRPARRAGRLHICRVPK
jgi:hypothetical protein